MYALAPHAGRGGWTWYTGSAGWLYRLITESLLGLRVEAGTLRLQPCLPPHWPGYAVAYRHHATVYRIQVLTSSAVDFLSAWTVDGQALEGNSLDLVDDGVEHTVLVRLAAMGDPL